MPFRATFLLQAHFRLVLGFSWCILGALLDPAGVLMAAKMQPKQPKWHQKALKIISPTGLIFAIILEYFPYLFGVLESSRRVGLALGSPVSSNPWQFCIRKRGLFEYRSLFQEPPLAVLDFIMPQFLY